MLRVAKVKFALFLTAIILVVSIVLAITSMYSITNGDIQSHILYNSTFTLSPNEVYRQGLGSFRGIENISLLIQSPTAFNRNFSIATYNGLQFNVSSSSDISYVFTAGADYYDAVFIADGSENGTIHFQASVTQPRTAFPYSWLNQPAKILFIASIFSAIAIISWIYTSNKDPKLKLSTPLLPSVSRKTKRYLVLLVAISLVIWLIILAFNANSLATFENWYTDNGRHTYTSNLFLKFGFSVFDTPLSKLSNTDNSYYKFVTWPDMPHLYPLGSIFLFLPFGLLIQAGANAGPVFKLEIAFFLIIAHVCLYFFLIKYLKRGFGTETRLKNASLREQVMNWVKLAGFYIVYISLVIYAADGMFDAVAFLFSLISLFMFIEERYGLFFLLISISIFFKYQAGIFFLPLAIVGIIVILQKKRLDELLRTKEVIGSLLLIAISLFTAWLSEPFFLSIEPQFITNGINAFSLNTQIPWVMQATWILLTLTVTLAYAVYMLRKNSLLSLLSVFLLLPVFMLPYFQNWYLPYIFVYILILQRKKELEVTIVWLIFMVFMLSFGGTAFNPLQILSVTRGLFHL